MLLVENMVVPISLFYYVYSPGRTIAATVPSHNNNNLPETNEATVRIVRIFTDNDNYFLTIFVLS